MIDAYIPNRVAIGSGLKWVVYQIQTQKGWWGYNSIYLESSYMGNIMSAGNAKFQTRSQQS